MQMERFQEPWPYLVVDNYFGEDEFKEVKEIASAAFKQHQIKSDTRNLIVAPEKIALLDKHDYWSFYDQLKGSDRFPHTQIDRELNLLIPKKDKPYIYPVHDEHQDKILSIVVYISPKLGSGTQIYTPEKSFFGEPEWRPNRAFIFSGIKGITWHGYKCEPQNKFRLTYNAFIRKSRY